MTCSNVITDIFAVDNCTLAYNNCASTQQVQVFLWQQIKKLQIFCNNFNQAQGIINDQTDGKLNQHENAITLIQNDIATLKTLAKNLETSQAQVIADNNAFKLGVDETLRLYQTTINSITTNLNQLQVDNQALENRVGILESQTDLKKLQDIIKTWEQIREQFDAELQQSVTDMTNLVNNAITENELKIDKKFSDFVLEVTKNVSELTQIVNSNTLSVANLSNAFVDLNQNVLDLAAHTESEFFRLDGLIEETAQNTLADAKAYTDDEISKSDKRTSDIISEFRLEVNNQLSQFWKNVTTELNRMDLSIETIRADYVSFHEMYTKFVFEINETIQTMQMHARQNYELAYDANRNANNAVELANQLAVIVNKYEERFIYYDYDLVNIRESLKYINSSILRAFIPSSGIFNIKIGSMEINSGKVNINVNPNVYRILSVSYKFDDETNKIEKIVSQDTSINGADINNFQSFKVVSIIDHSQYTLQIRQMADGTQMFELINCCDNEFNIVYFPLEPLGDTPLDSIIVDVDIHPAPKPEPKPEPCKPIPIVIVNKQCEEIDMKPEAGRDGRDGRDGASVDDITLTVEEKERLISINK